MPRSWILPEAEVCPVASDRRDIGLCQPPAPEHCEHRVCLSIVSNRPSTRSQPCCTCWVLTLRDCLLFCIPLPNDGCQRRVQRCRCYHSLHCDCCRVYEGVYQTSPSFDANCHQDSLQSKGAYTVPSLWAMTLTSWYGTNIFT